MDLIRCRGRCLRIVVLLGGLSMLAGRLSAADGADIAEDSLPVAEVAAEQGLTVFDLPVPTPAGPYWLRTDYLMWWTRGTRLPPLVTTGTLPAADILYGDERVLQEGRSGFRTTFGMWLDACRVWDVQFEYLTLGEQSSSFSQSSTGDPVLARPFYNVQTGLEASFLVASPNMVQGTISVDARDYFQSAGMLVGYTIFGGDESAFPDDSGWSYGNRIDLVGGFRYYNLSDRLGITAVVNVTQPGPTQNTVFRFRDSFRANNDFYGADLGFRAHMHRGRWSLKVLAKIALGNTNQTVNIDGETIVVAPNQPVQVYDAGLLALDTNSGVYRRNMFTMIPQLGLELGYQFNSHWRVHFGYDALYWARVARAADQIDLNVDPRNFPPPLAGGTRFPEHLGCTNSFWAQGISVGAELRF
jgi:hypothetical protein